MSKYDDLIKEKTRENKILESQKATEADIKAEKDRAMRELYRPILKKNLMDFKGAMHNLQFKARISFSYTTMWIKKKVVFNMISLPRYSYTQYDHRLTHSDSCYYICDDGNNYFLTAWYYSEKPNFQPYSGDPTELHGGTYILSDDQLVEVLINFLPSRPMDREEAEKVVYDYFAKIIEEAIKPD